MKYIKNSQTWPECSSSGTISKNKKKNTLISIRFFFWANGNDDALGPLQSALKGY